MTVNAHLYPTTEELPEEELTYLSQVLYPEDFDGSNWTLSTENDAKEKTLDVYSEIHDVVSGNVRQEITTRLEARVTKMVKRVAKAQNAKKEETVEHELAELKAELNDLVDDVMYPED